MITIAIAKGRILTEAFEIFAKIGIVPQENIKTTRKLIIESNNPEIRFLIVRTSDVPIYVEYKGADLGIVGSDVLMEYDSNQYYEMLDLQIAKCKMMVATKNTSTELTGRIRVATKFPNITKNYFSKQGKQVDIIKLYGSMELAPLVDMADCIVDIVDTGKTLVANDLKATELIANISSKMIVNKISIKKNYPIINQLLADLKQNI